MSIIATAVKHLLAAGVTGDALVQAIAEMEASQPVKVDRVAENRRAYDRDRKRKRKALSTGIPVEPVESAIPPNDIYSNPPEPLSSNEDSPPLPDRVVKAWNDGPAKSGATHCRALDASRRKQLSARIREHGEAAVFEAIEHLRQSEFHCGRNDRGWTASLGWLLESPRNFLKALELQTRDPPSNDSDSLIDKILAEKARAA